MKKKRKTDIESDNLHSISRVIKDTFMQIEHQADACSGEGIPSGFSAFSLNIVRHAGVECGIEKAGCHLQFGDAKK